MLVDFTTLVPASYKTVAGNIKLVISGDFARSTELRSGPSRPNDVFHSLRTMIPNQPVIIRFTPIVHQVDFVAKANTGEEKYLPKCKFCGINTYDNQPICQTETVQAGPDGNYRSFWHFGTPANDEWLIDYMEITNLELWSMELRE